MLVSITDLKYGKVKEVEKRYADILVKLGKHKYTTTEATTTHKTAVYETRDMSASSDDGLTELREQYQALVGKKPYMGWGADKLKEKIAKAEKAGDDE